MTITDTEKLKFLFIYYKGAQKEIIKHIQENRPWPDPDEIRKTLEEQGEGLICAWESKFPAELKVGDNPVSVIQLKAENEERGLQFIKEHVLKFGLKAVYTDSLKSAKLLAERRLGTTVVHYDGSKITFFYNGDKKIEYSQGDGNIDYLLRATVAMAITEENVSDWTWMLAQKLVETSPKNLYVIPRGRGSENNALLKRGASFMDSIGDILTSVEGLKEYIGGKIDAKHED